MTVKARSSQFKIRKTDITYYIFFSTDNDIYFVTRTAIS